MKAKVKSKTKSPDREQQRAELASPGFTLPTDTPTDLVSLLKRLAKGDDRAIDRVSAKGARAIPPLLAMLGGEDEDAAIAASNALIAIGNSAVPALLSALHDDNWRLRAGAASALGFIVDINRDYYKAKIVAPGLQSDAVAAGRPEDYAPRWTPIVDALLRLLAHDPEALVRADAAVALGLIRDPRAVEPLMACLDGEDNRVRESAARALGDIGDERALSALERTAKMEHVPRSVAEVARQARHRILGQRDMVTLILKISANGLLVLGLAVMVLAIVLKRLPVVGILVGTSFILMGIGVGCGYLLRRRMGEIPSNLSVIFFGVGLLFALGISFLAMAFQPKIGEAIMAGLICAGLPIFLFWLFITTVASSISSE